MKKIFILSVLAFALIGSLSFAEEKVLIDFAKLSADVSVKEGDENPTQNEHTLMDFGAKAGMTFTSDEKKSMKSSLAIGEWEVQLNSSARTTESLANSLVKVAPVREGEDVMVKFADGTKREVMGVRVHFPSSNVSANARILPPFEIPASDPRFVDGYGVVTNVGTIKSIKVTTLGMNQPHKLYVIFKDQLDNERRYCMGDLNFDGWRELKWNNPTYVQEVRAREIRSMPIYPTATPYIKFAGFQIVRDAVCEGGDFIGYFKDVAVIYDKATLKTERDIADEDIWGIISEREKARQEIEMRNFGKKQVERFTESAKQATEEDFTSSLISEEGNGDAQQPAEAANTEPAEAVPAEEPASEPQPAEEPVDEPAAEEPQPAAE